MMGDQGTPKSGYDYSDIIEERTKTKKEMEENIWRGTTAILAIIFFIIFIINPPEDELTRWGVGVTLVISSLIGGGLVSVVAPAIGEKFTDKKLIIVLILVGISFALLSRFV